jgi:uncharacterized membrane protein
MGTLPPLPNWQELHPLVIHFPIVLLLLAPLFVVLGAALRSERSRMFLISALILMLLGTASLYISTQTGDAASRQHQLSPQVSAVLLQHRTMAAETRTNFTVVTAMYGLLLLLTLRFRLDVGELAAFLPVAFIAFYALGICQLLSIAHLGGQLVHKFGL